MSSDLMSSDLHPVTLAFSQPPHESPALELDCFSFDERRVLLPAISEAMTLCGCWLLDRRALSLTQIEFRFEFQLCSAVELYAALVAAGLQLTRASHLHLTSLCMVRKHGSPRPGLAGLVNVRLAVSFLDDATLPPMRRTGMAFA